MCYLLHDLITMRKNRVVDITVYDGFSGRVKILKACGYKWFIEIIDVTMCYPQLKPFVGGETLWVYRRDLCRD